MITNYHFTTCNFLRLHPAVNFFHVVCKLIVIYIVFCVGFTQIEKYKEDKKNNDMVANHMS